MVAWTSAWHWRTGQGVLVGFAGLLLQASLPGSLQQGSFGKLPVQVTTEFYLMRL